MKTVLPFVTFAFLAFPAAAAAEAGRTVDMEVHDEGNLVAAPTVTLEVGRSTSLSAPGYALRVRMDRSPGGSDAGPFTVRSNLYSAAANWALVATPTVTVAAGGSSSVEVVGRDGRRVAFAITVR